MGCAARLVILSCLLAGGLPTLNEARARVAGARVRAISYAEIGYWNIDARYRGSTFEGCVMSHDLGLVPTADLGEGIKAHAFILANGVLSLRASVPWQLESGKHLYQIAVGGRSWKGSLEILESQIYEYAEAYLDLPRDQRLLKQMRRAAFLELRAPDLKPVRVGLDKFSPAIDLLHRCYRDKGIKKASL